MNAIQKVNVIGLGYIGLPTAATLANAGFDVLGVEVNPKIIEKINTGSIHIQEPGLDILVRAAFQRGKLRASADPEEADAHIIAVPTPINEDKSPGLSYVEAASKTIARVVRAGDLVVLESTVPPRTCEEVVAPILYEATGLRADRDYFLAHCPERVIPGKILEEIIHNDRIIGGVAPEATKRTVELYASFVKGKLLETDATTAEMCKLMENTFRDVNIALANELANIAEQIGVNIEEAIRFANHHPRVHIHTPGIGVGGHCIPIDPWFIVHAAPDHSRLIQTARKINDARPRQMAEKVAGALEAYPGNPVAFFGLSYKSDVDDVRESPAIEIVHLVAERFSRPIYVVEPFTEELPEPLTRYAHVHLADTETALEKAGILVGLVAHSAFKKIDTGRFAGRCVLDFVRLWD